MGVLGEGRVSFAYPDIVMHAARKLNVAIYSRSDREKSSAQVDF
jgi:hypothetical protein